MLGLVVNINTCFFFKDEPLDSFRTAWQTDGGRDRQENREADGQTDRRREGRRTDLRNNRPARTGLRGGLCEGGGSGIDRL